MIDGYAIMDKINEEIMNFQIPIYEIYFYKQNNRKPEKVITYTLNDLGQMNQLKIDIAGIISNTSKYNQYNNYTIDLIYIDGTDKLNFISPLREYDQSEDEEFLSENCVGQG